MEEYLFSYPLRVSTFIYSESHFKTSCWYHFNACTVIIRYYLQIKKRKYKYNKYINY